MITIFFNMFLLISSSIPCRFLPSIFMDAMKDDADASVNLFEGHSQQLSHFEYLCTFN